MIDAIKIVTQSIVEGFKMLPVWAVIMWNSFVAAVPTLTMVLAFLYLILQISYILWKWNIERKEQNNTK